MAKRSATKGKAKNLPTRQLQDGRADRIKGGLLPATSSPATRGTKNEVAIEVLEIAHAGLRPASR
jgi:hypothetical protein